MTRIMMAALLLAAQPVLANPISEVRVSVSDLNLQHVAGVRTLDARLARAASQVCRGGAGMPTAGRVTASACRRAALERARPARDAAIAAATRTEQLASR